MPSRLVVLGLDGATWNVLTPLAAQGVMPNVRRLMQASALVELNSTQPFITPVAWASFQTGCDPHEHGILDYRYFDERTRQLCLNNTTRLRRATLFQSIAAAGGEVASLNLPLTFPPPAAVGGIVVGGLDSPSAQAALAHVPHFAERLRQRGIGLSLKPIWKRVPESFEELTACVAQTVIDFRARAAAAHVADELCQWQLLFVQFQTLDAMQHRAWHLLGLDSTAPATPREGSRKLRLEVSSASVARLHEAFHALDQSIGQLAELAARRGAQVVAVSDHGFGSFRGKISLPELLAGRGLLTRSTIAHRIRHGISRAGFRARKWLWRRRRPGASTASLARPLEMLQSINWRTSRAVALHGDLAAMIYLNTPERFGRGPLTTARLADETRAEAIAALREARHPLTDEPLFADVYAVQERLGIDPLAQQWPEIIGIPAEGFQTRTRIVQAGKLMVEDPQLSGTHRLQGVLMLPSAPQTAPRQAEMRDVAPTLLSLLRIARPNSMSGRSLMEPAIPAGELSPEAPQPAAAASPVLSGAQQAVVEARLRDLGYLD